MKQQVFVKPTGFKGIKQNPSLLGFGCMRFPTLENGDIDEQRSKAIIDEAFKHGVNYFDTAYPYHQGASETFIGKVLSKYPREQFYLANKMPGWLLKTVDDAKRIFTEQLEKCQVDYFDYYLCHALGERMYKAYSIPGVMEFLHQMKEEGKIRHLGFSFHDTPEVLETIIKDQPWDFVQLQLNYLDWSFQNAKKQYDTVKQAGIPCIVMEPVRGGTLANLCEESAAILKQANPDVSLASWAIRYAASFDQVMVVLSGMSNEDQTMDNIRTLTDFIPITSKEQTVIDKALETFLKSNTVPCTACNYCMPCPEGVNIPGLFKAYNAYKLSKFAPAFIRQYEAFKESERADQCIECGLCLSQCPQKIDIPTIMNEMDSIYQALIKEA